MPLKFNPFSGNFDFAPGVGGTVFDGEVNVFSDLPETVSNPPVNSAYLVRNTEGTIWFGNRKQKGIYIRSGNSGVRNDDWTYGGDYPVTSVNGLTGDVTVPSDFGATPRIMVGANTINGGVGNAFPSPYTTYTIPLPTRFGSQQNGVTRVWVSRPFSAANLTLNLPVVGPTPENGDIIEIRVLALLATYKVIVSTQGFGDFDLYGRQSAVFVYSSSSGPARWLRAYDNSFLTTLPTTPGSSTGNIGDMASSSTHFYVKVPTGGTPEVGEWRRVPWSVWT